MLPSPDDRAEVSVEAILVRYASGGLVQDGIVDGAVFKSVDGRAFRTRPGEGGELSVNELGIFSEDEEADLHEIRRIRAQWMTIRRTGRFAQIAVKDVEECAAESQLPSAIGRPHSSQLKSKVMNNAKMIHLTQ